MITASRWGIRICRIGQPRSAELGNLKVHNRATGYTRTNDSSHYWDGIERLSYALFGCPFMHFLLDKHIREFSQIYAGTVLKPLRVQYRDYSEWLKNRDLSKQKQFWITEFEESVPMLDMPLDFSRPKMQSFKGSHIQYTMDRTLTDSIEKVNQIYGTTRFMTMLAAFSVLLHKYSGQDDIVIGTPVSGRTHPDTEAMLGMFVNTLAMRTHPSPEKTFGVILEEVKRFSLDAFENQEYPFEELIEQINVERDMSRNPLFDVMFAMQNNEEMSLNIRDIKVKMLPIDSAVSKFDMSVDVVEKDGAIHLSLEYCTDLFTSDTMNHLLRHYEQLLKVVTHNPNVRLKEIELVTPEERARILSEFNTSDVEYPFERTIIDLFEDQVARVPENVAVICGNKRLTYAELNEKANMLAWKLRELGLRPDDRVALVSERSLEMIIGILGTLKAGGAYVPIDPDYPEDRIKYTLQDCGAKVVLVCGVKLSTWIDVPVLDLLNELSYANNKRNVERIISVSNLAYIIYTSGTTGRPKGVMIEHHALTEYVYNFVNEFSVCENDTVLQQAFVGFDTSVEEIYPALVVGGKIVIVDLKRLGSIEDLQNIIEINKVTIISVSPLLLGEISHSQGLETLRVAISGGDVLQKANLENISESVMIYNTYGPTEATVCATYYRVNSPNLDGSDNLTNN